MADKALFPKYLGKRRGQVWNSFGKILPKVGIYPRHWYSESLNYTCFRELNVLFLWVAYVNISQEQGFWKVKFDIASASRRSWYESESGVKAGPKQDPKTFKSSSDIKVQFNRRKWYLFDLSPVFFSLLSQVFKTGQEIGFSEYLSADLCCKGCWFEIETGPERD